MTGNNETTNRAGVRGRRTVLVSVWHSVLIGFYGFPLSQYTVIILRSQTHVESLLFCYCAIFQFHRTSNRDQMYTIGSDVISVSSSISSLIFTAGGQKVWNLVSVFDPGRIWHALVSKRRNLSKTFNSFSD